MKSLQPKGNFLARRLLAHAVGIHQKLGHHRQMVGGLSTLVALLVFGEDQAQIQLIHHVADKQRQMLFGKPVPKRGGQQKQLIWIVGFEAFHAPYYS